MDGAMARAAQVVDDAELPDGLTRRRIRHPCLRAPVVEVRRREEDAIKELFAMSATRYYQVLNALVDRPEGIGCRPDARQATSPVAGESAKARAARRLGFEVP